MILPDINILLYATDEDSGFHEPAKQWLNDVLSTEQVFFTWQTLTGFLRLITHPAASKTPLKLTQAIEVVEEWLALDNTYLVSLEKERWPVFSQILLDGQATGNLVMDAHIAAVAKSYGAAVATTDRDFNRFAGLAVFDPLIR